MTWSFDVLGRRCVLGAGGRCVAKVLCKDLFSSFIQKSLFPPDVKKTNGCLLILLIPTSLLHPRHLPYRTPYTWPLHPSHPSFISPCPILSILLPYITHTSPLTPHSFPCPSSHLLHHPLTPHTHTEVTERG